MLSLWIGASGLAAGRLQMDITAHNVANANTEGFQAAHAHFRNELYRPLTRPAVTPRDELPSAGGGVVAVATSRSTEQGPIIASPSPYHLAIEGPGYFRLRAPDGSIRYTRDGAFQPDGEGRLVSPGGEYLLDDAGRVITLPAGTRSVTVAEDGVVTAETGNGSEIVATIALAVFVNPGGLESVGNNMFVPSLSSGPAQLLQPGSGSGRIRQGALEKANVELGVEMVNMLLAHRHAQFSARVVQTSDEMMAMANRLPS